MTDGGSLGLVDRDSLICDENHKHIKLHVTTCFSTFSALATWNSELAPQLSMLSPPSFVTVFITRSSPAESSLVMAKGKRGAKFTIAELECLLDAIDEIVPIGNPDWERVWDKHVSTFPKKERTVESLKQKFQGLARHKIPTGDPECPPHIRNAKRIYRRLFWQPTGQRVVLMVLRMKMMMMEKKVMR